MYDCSTEIEYLKKFIRPVTQQDKKNLPTYSHSRLETFENCPYKYNLQYEQKKRPQESSLALELGTICHRVYEVGAQMWLKGHVDYDDLFFLLEYGDLDKKILGINDLSKKYFEDWFEIDSEGHSYKWKIDKFKTGLVNYFNELKEWKPYKQEYPFEFVFNNRAIIMGYIDAILINDKNELYCLDYKTSKKPFPDSKIPTSQQFSIYCMAILNDFDKLPIQCDYKFILLNIDQNALTTGFSKRIVKKLNTMMDKIDSNKKSGVWIPNPSPLCWYCSYNKNNPKNQDYKNECNYYSLWSPTDKRWDVNRRFNVLDLTKNKDVNKIDSSNEKRKLVF